MAATGDFAHLDTLTLPGADLEIYCDPLITPVGQPAFWVPPDALSAELSRLWERYHALALEAGFWQALGLSPESQRLEIELTWTGNSAIHALNRDYREKDQATDVLTFSLYAEAPDRALWQRLPSVQLGGCFVSLDWAADTLTREQSSPTRADFTRYVLERVVHGWLHLMGRHHDTMADYERVVAWQHRVLDEALSP